jgi:hypothetical protein
MIFVPATMPPAQDDRESVRDTMPRVRHVGAFAFYLALAVAMTWPLATELSTAVPDLGDPLLNAWIVDWVCHALTHAPLGLFDAPMYYPATNILAFSENMIGIALIVLPFHVAGLPPLTVYNIALLIVHEARLTAEQRTALQPLLAKLQFVRRIGTDVVYGSTMGRMGPMGPMGRMGGSYP